MSNYRSLKDIFDKKINRDEIYKIVTKQNKFRYNTLKYILVPIPIVIIVSLSFFTIKDYHRNMDVIMINQVGEINYQNGIFDTLGTITKISNDKNQEIKEEYPFLNSLDLPNDIKYDKGNGYIYYNNEFTNTSLIYEPSIYWYEYKDKEDNKEIILSFSTGFDSMLSQIGIIHLNNDAIEFKDSTINNHLVKIQKYKDSYMAIFEYKDINFEILTKNITQEELIELIKSILK